MQESMEEFWDEMMPGRYPPPLDIIFTEEKKLEREEVMAEMQPLLQRLRDNWTQELNADLQAALTPGKLQVMDPEAKALLSKWIDQRFDPKYGRWLKDAEADLTSVISKEKFMLYGGEYWSSTLVMSKHMHDLERGVEILPLSPEQKDFLQKGFDMLNEFIKCVEWHNKRGIPLPVLDPETFEILKRSKDIKCNLPPFLRDQAKE
ncbi:hypothetical protein V8C40DRAFT_283139 [Trichoderma camerunense]